MLPLSALAIPSLFALLARTAPVPLRGIRALQARAAQTQTDFSLAQAPAPSCVQEFFLDNQGHVQSSPTPELKAAAVKTCPPFDDGQYVFYLGWDGDCPKE